MNHLEEAQAIMSLTHDEIATSEATTHALIAIAEQLEKMNGKRGTCSTCTHRNEGDRHHGMYCNYHEWACEYSASCLNYKQEKK